METKIENTRRFFIRLPDGGGRLEAVWIGAGSEPAPTLVFLHEGLGCVALWRDFPARLAESVGCSALLYSRLGYGGSDGCQLPRPVDFLHHEGCVVLPEVIRRCGIRDHILVGHSDGGSIALIHAGSAPSPGLLGVITLAAHVFCEPVTRKAIERTGRRFRDGGLKRRLAVYHGENTDCAFFGWHDVWLHPDFKHWCIDAELKRISVPVLAIQGVDDPYGTADQVERIRQTCAGETIVAMLADCGHAPHVEKTGAVMTAAEPFMNRLISGPSAHTENNACRT